jgi:hypothetical protein
VSKYCLQHSPVPVIVVRPTSKRDKAKSKRTNDPDRQGYREILAKSESLPEFNSPRNSFFANEDEAAIVGGAAIAPKPAAETHPLAQVEQAPDSSEDELDTGTSTFIGDDPRSPGPMMKSPHLQNLDSPELSSQSSSEDEDDQGGVSTSGTSAVDKVTSATERSRVGDGDAGSGNTSMSYIDSLTSGAQTKSEDTSSEQKDSEGA